jgi:hypothetical protein
MLVGFSSFFIAIALVRSMLELAFIYCVLPLLGAPMCPKRVSDLPRCVTIPCLKKLNRPLTFRSHYMPSTSRFLCHASADAMTHSFRTGPSCFTNVRTSRLFLTHSASKTGMNELWASGGDHVAHVYVCACSVFPYFT